MENFEYSIRLNDRDWAEFYLASEECSLIQPALATADEPLLSDLEEGELDQIRWDIVLTQDTAVHLPQRAPDTHLLAEDLLSGSEDETELGSVSTFLCHNNPSNTVPSSWMQESQLSGVTLKHSGSHFGMATPTTENEAAKEEDSEMGNCPKNYERSSPVVELPSLQERHLGKEAMESPLSMRQDASTGMDGTARENGSETISLQLQSNQNDAMEASSANSQSSTSRNGTVAAENSESLWRRDPISYPCSPDVSSPLPTERRDPIPYPCSPGVSSPLPTEQRDPIPYPLSPGVSSPLPTEQRDPIPSPCSPGVSSTFPTEPGGTKNPKKSSKDLQIFRQPTPFHENPFQGYTSTAFWEPPNPLPGKHIEGPQERASYGGEDAQSSKEMDHNDILKEKDHVGEVSSSPCHDVALSPEGPEGNSRESYYGLGMVESFLKESQPTIQGSQSSDFRGEFVPFCLTSQDSPESQEKRRNVRERTRKEGPVSYPATELPSMSGPEMYEYFFDEGDESQRSKDGGDKDTAAKASLLSGHLSTPSVEDPNSEEAVQISIPEVYEYFFDNSARRKKSWRGVLLSFPASEARKAAKALKSLIGRHMRRAKPKPTNHGELIRRGSQGALVLLSPGLLTEAQSRPEVLHMAVMEPERPLQPVLMHRDMCLGFVAFASWAVKTSDLQAPDAWKIVLLANFGTLSAIRYFRRQVITEGQHAT